jgi:hypothetical protein
MSGTPAAARNVGTMGRHNAEQQHCRSKSYIDDTDNGKQISCLIEKIRIVQDIILNL